MKNLKSTLLSTAIIASVFSLSAQTQLGENNQKSKAGDNWFISIGGGANLLIGEQDEERSVSDRLRFGGELSVGKWFNPCFGMRTQIYLGGLKGFNYKDSHTFGGEYTRNNRSRSEYPIGYHGSWEESIENGNLKAAGNNGFWQEFSYGTMTIDLMANLTNLFRGYYKDNAPIEVIPFVGLGYIHAIKSNTNPTYDNMVAKVGTRVNFNLNPKLAIYIEPQANFTTDELDGYVGHRNTDVILNTMAGIQFNINKNFAPVTSLSQSEVDILNKKINEQHQMIENQQGILERQQQMLRELENKQSSNNSNRPHPQTSTTVSSGGKYLPEYIRFGLNSSSIDISEKYKIEDAAAYLKANPGSKLLMIGYADRKTGNSSYNYKLSCRRVDTIADQLKNLGIESNRLVIQCVGDKEQPYDQNDWNRVVILVER